MTTRFSAAARSMVAFAVYMTLTGLVLAVSPNVLLTTIRLPPTTEPWIRVLGMFMIIVSYYYYRIAASEASDVMRGTVHGRTIMAMFLVALAVTGLSGPVMVLFGLGELTGAIATALALRADAHRPPAALARS